MKIHNSFRILAAIAVLILPISMFAQSAPKTDGKSLLGAWKLVSFNYGDQAAFSDYPKERQRLKMITSTHFTWVDFDANTKQVASSAGGPYTLRGGVYTETIEFVGEGMEAYLGKKQEFTIRIEGDKLHQSGQLSDGLKIEEVWQRAQPKED